MVCRITVHWFGVLVNWYSSPLCCDKEYEMIATKLASYNLLIVLTLVLHCSVISLLSSILSSTVSIFLPV